MNKIELKFSATIEETVIIDVTDEELSILKERGKLKSPYSRPYDESTDELYDKITDFVDESSISEIEIKEVKKAKYNGKIGPDMTFVPGKGLVVIEENGGQNKV